MNLILFSGLTGVLMMFLGLVVKNKRSISYIAMSVMALLFVLNTMEMRTAQAVFELPIAGMLEMKKYGLLVNSILLMAGLLYFMLSGREIEKVGRHVADYYALIFFIFVGIGLVTSYNNLLLLFIGIEIISIPLYILTGADKKNLRSNEASLKYLLMGAFSTGLMLMGIALIYGASGSFLIERMSLEYTPLNYNMVGGMLLILSSMSFKVSAAPFHFWTPDVYDGAPTVFTSFMATIVKVAAFVAFIRLFQFSYDIFFNKWQLVISLIIACTLLIGNITAVFQQSVKRMLAYSSISQAGFMLFALFAYNSLAQEGILLYAAAYCLATIGIFAVLAKMEDYTFDGFNGFANRYPLLAFLLTVFLLSLAGIPLTAGFFSKYYMVAAAFRTAAGGKFLWLIVLAMLCAAVSVYYYFRVIQAMYFKSGEAQTISVSMPFKLILFVMAVLIVILGILPQMLLQYLYF